MRVVVCRVGEIAVIEEIEDSLEAWQKLVGGYIQATYPYEDLVAIICDEEGKVNGKKLNRAIRDDSGKMVDVIAGDFFVCGLTDEDFVGLDEEMAEKYQKMFDCPEAFIRIGGTLMGLPYDPRGLEEKEDNE